MTLFVLICAAMVSLALAIIIPPLIKGAGRKPQQLTIVILAIGLPLAALLLYSKIGDPSVISASSIDETSLGPPAPVRQVIERARSEPENFEAQVQAADLYYRIQRYDEAIAHLSKANRLRPDDPVVLEAYCLVLIHQGDKAQAQQILDRLATVDPNNLDLPQIRTALKDVNRNR